MGFEKDIPPGKVIVASFRPFLEYLIALDLSRKTVRKHVDNLWVLGGELIRDLNENPSLRNTPIADRLFDAAADGGLLSHHLDSDEKLRSFQSTCRKLRRFLQQQQST